ncbi:glycosyltransferase [Gammaproteobacteria bacterium]|nr:glycosyltransferase [Gammaproteobacteria bacterium]
MINSLKNRRILVIPDSIWGEDSGHRSTQFLLKTLERQDNHVAVYAEDNLSYLSQKKEFIEKNRIEVFPKTPYRFKDQLFILNAKVKKEFYEVLNNYNPDLVFYFGTINNKVSINFLSNYKRNIPYYYLPLTNEFWCFKDFAGREDGECFKCIKGNYFSSYRYKCIEDKSIFYYLKKYIEAFHSKWRMQNAKAVFGYSDSQKKSIISFGVDSRNLSKTKIFFDRETVGNIKSRKGDYIVVIGQLSVAKGWHIVPEIIEKNKNKDTKFKLIIFKKEKALRYIRDNNLEQYLESGKIEILSGLKSHKDVLKVVAESLAVFIPSTYPTTGEFALLESMGLSKPVLAFNVGAHRDFLVSGENALVSEHGDIEGINSNIDKLYLDNDLWLKISNNSKATFEDLTDFSEYL